MSTIERAEAEFKVVSNKDAEDQKGSCEGEAGLLNGGEKVLPRGHHWEVETVHEDVGVPGGKVIGDRYAGTTTGRSSGNGLEDETLSNVS